MLEYILLLGLVAAVTVALLCLVSAGTKETSFEDAVAEQQRLRQKEGGSNKAKKSKAPKKVRPARSRTQQSNGGASAPRSASTGQDSAGTSTEDDNHEEQQLLAYRRQQELKRQQAEQQRQLAEEQHKQAEQQKQLAEQQRLQAEQQEHEKQQKEEQEQLEQQKQREQEAQQQEEERQQKRHQQVLEQHRQQEIVEQESKKNEKKKKQLKNDEAKQKQQRASKSGGGGGGGMLNGVHIESVVEAVASNGMTVDGSSLRMNGKKNSEGDKTVKKSAARLQDLSTSREEVSEKALHNGGSAVAPAGLPAKKNKRGQQKLDKIASVQAILQTVEEAQLSSDQLQQVVDSLLAAAADGGWSEARKGVEVAVAKKLEEANSVIARHQEELSALAVKISDMRTDLNSERAKNTLLKRQLETATAEQQQQAQRDQQQQLQHKQQMQQSVNQQVVQQIQEERGRLQMEHDEKIRQLEASSAESTRAAHESAVQHMQQQEQAALLRIQELQSELTAANSQLQQSQFTAEQLSHTKADLENRVQGSQQELQKLSSAVEERTIMVHHLQQEKEALQKVADESARTAADHKEKSNDCAALELTISSQAVELEQQKQEADALSGEVRRLNTELESVKTKNDELRDKNSTVLKAYQELEANLEAKEKKHSSEALELRNLEEGYRQLLSRLHPGVSLSASSDGRAWQDEFERGAKERQQKDEEVEVVKVIVEKEVQVQDPKLLAKLQKLEDDNQLLLDKAARLEEQLTTARKELNAQPPPNAAEQELLQSLQLENKQLQKDKKLLAQASERVQQLEDENKQLLEDRKQLQVLQEENKQIQTLRDELQLQKEENQQLQNDQTQLKLLQKENHLLQKDKNQLKLLQEENERLQADQKQTQQLQEDSKRLQEDNKLLQEKVLHHQSVLDNTEKLLTTLQKSVETEEGKWMSLVKSKEDTIEEITKENETLSQQILASSSAEKLEAELQRVQQEKAHLQDQLTALGAKAEEVASLRELLAEGVEAGKEQEQIIEQLQAELEKTKDFRSKWFEWRSPKF